MTQPDEPRCETCRYWRRKAPRDLNAEFEADPRPTVRNLWDVLSWIFGGSDNFKSRPSSIAMDFIHDPSPTMGRCKRWPEPVWKLPNDYCGEHTTKETPDAR